MSQRKNLLLLLKLHNIITKTNMSLEEIVNNRTIDPDISLIDNSDLGGRVSYGKKIPITNYYSLGEHLGNRLSAKTQ
ncbi:hypothetical protein R84B8_02387 [Treponema sp. R8-4-B8]